MFEYLDKNLLNLFDFSKKFLSSWILKNPSSSENCDNVDLKGLDEWNNHISSRVWVLVLCFSMAKRKSTKATILSWFKGREGAQGFDFERRPTVCEGCIIIEDFRIGLKKQCIYTTRRVAEDRLHPAGDLLCTPVKGFSSEHPCLFCLTVFYSSYGKGKCQRTISELVRAVGHVLTYSNQPTINSSCLYNTIWYILKLHCQHFITKTIDASDKFFGNHKSVWVKSNLFLYCKKTL